MIERTEFASRKELEEYLKSLWRNCRNENDEFDTKFFIGKKVIYKGDGYNGENIISNIITTQRTKKSTSIRVCLETSIEVPLYLCKVLIYNPIVDKDEFISLAKLIKNKFYINGKIFKQLYYKTKEYKDKLHNSNVEKYGEDYNVERRKKASDTMLEKFGVPYFLCRGDAYDKSIKPIMIERYGTPVPIKNKEIKKKISGTIKEKYGVDWFLQRGEHYTDSIEKIMLELYGTKNIFYLSKFIKYHSVSKEEKNILKEIITLFNFTNCHYHENKQKEIIYFEKEKNKIRKYFLDFYDETNNLVIEIMGDFWHCNPKIFPADFVNRKTKLTAEEVWEKDRIRKQRIINELHCDFFVIWISEWQRNKEIILKELHHVIESKKNN